MTKKDQQLATIPVQALTDIKSLRVAFDESKYNLLMPVVHLPDGLPPGTRFSVTEITISADLTKKEVYPSPGGGLELHKVSLDKIGNAAGISWTDEKRQDAASHPHYVEMFVRGKIRDFDGTERGVTGIKAVDLREDAGGGIPGKDYADMTSKNKSPQKQLLEARKFIQEIAASKAKNRAIASGLAIKRGYTKQELMKPFIVPKLALDTKDASVQHAVVAGMVGENAIKAMFGPDPNQQKIVDAEIEDSAGPDLPSQESSGDQSADGGSPPSADFGPPPMGEPEEPEKPDAEEIKQRLTAVWQVVKPAGFKLGQWTEFIKTNSGKNNESELTFEDLDLLDGAAAAFVDATQD